MSGDEKQILTASGNWAFIYVFSDSLPHYLGMANQQAPLPFELQWFLHPAPEPGRLPLYTPNSVSDDLPWLIVASAHTGHSALLAATLDITFSEALSTAYQWGEYGVTFTYDDRGERQWIPEFLAQGPEALRDFGIWNIMLPRYVTLRDDLSRLRRYNQLAIDQAAATVDAAQRGEVIIYYRPFDPLLTEEQREERALIVTPTNTVRDEWLMQMIIGQRSVDEWDDMLAAVHAVGDLHRLVELYNSADQRPPRAPFEQRNFLIP